MNCYSCKYLYLGEHGFRCRNRVYRGEQHRIVHNKLLQTKSYKEEERQCHKK